MKLSYSQFGNLIGTALYNAGIYDSPTRWSLSDTADSEYIYNTKLKNNHSCFDLLIIRNKVTGNKTFFFTFRTQLTNSEYRFRSGEFSSNLRGYVLFEGNNIYTHGGSTGHTFLSNVNGLTVAYVKPNRPSDVDWVEGFSSHMGNMTPVTNYWRNIGYDTMAMFNGCFYLNHAQSEYGYFYGNMTKEQCMDVNNFEYEFLYHNEVFWDEEPEPPDPPTPGEWAPTMEDFNMELELWSNFSKRKNSTKRPGITGTILNVTLMEPTSIMRPTFIITNVNFTWNYCKFGGRYYFINNITSIDKERIALECQIDVLATWKSNIMGSNAFIKRAAWATGHLIADPLNPPTNDLVTKKTTFSSWTNGENYLIQYISAGITGIQAAIIGPMALAELMRYVNSVGTDPSVPQANVDYLMENIISIKAIPYTETGERVQLHIGAEDAALTGFNGYPLTVGLASLYFSNTQDISFPSSDYINETSYLDFEPYSMGLLYLPYVGIVPLDMDIIGKCRRVKIECQLNKSTADFVYSVYAVGLLASETLIATYSGNCGTEIPVFHKNIDQYGKTLGTLTSIGGAITLGAGILSGNPLMMAGGAGAMLSGGVNASRSAQVHTSVGGVLSSNIGGWVGSTVEAHVIMKKPINTDLDHNKTMFGLPVESVGSLNNSGYVQTVGANIQMAGTEQEKIEVNGLLDSGIFIE